MDTDGCRFQHPKDQQNNRFAPLQTSSPRGQSLPYSLSRDAIKADFTHGEDRPGWPLSAYAPGRDAPRQLLEGALEQSPEELRAQYYLAKAAGSTQQYEQDEWKALEQANVQSQRILNDLDGAIKYVIDAKDQHPNREDLTVKNTNNFNWVDRPSWNQGMQSANSSFGKPSPFGTGQSGNSSFGKSTTLGAQTSAFGQASGPPQNSPFGQAAAKPSVFGQPSAPSAQASAFGQPSSLGSTSSFGKPSALGGAASSFGQASNLGNPSAFGQASPFGRAASSFGQPSSIGQPSAFGQPSTPTSGSAFGQPSNLGKPSAFGQPSALGGAGGGAAGQGTSSFGQASAFGATSTALSSFGQLAQANSQQPAFEQSAPGAPSNASPFGKPSAPTTQQSPFGQPSAPTSQKSPFGQPSAPAAQQSPFGQPSSFGANAPKASPFGAPAPSAPQQSQQAGFPGSGNPAPGTNLNPSAVPASSAPPPHTGQPLTSFKGRPITRNADGHAFYQKANGKSERVFLADGPPGPNPDAEGAPEAYEGELAGILKGLYDWVRENGEFKFGIVPEVPPKREWVRWDL